MKRIQLFEFEDFSWFPTWLRTCMTNLIMVLHKMIGISDVLANLLADVLKKNNLTKIIDLGSGSGGPMPETIMKIRERHGLEEVQLVMTDLFPDLKTVQKFNQDTDDYIIYQETSVDAMNMVSAPNSLMTMMNSFHHMPPKGARKILELAQKNAQPILIYEMAENKMPLIIWWFLLPISLVMLMIMVLFMTPFVRPMTWQQLVFTYLIPIIPICYAWDGQVSMPRMYSFKDLDILLEGLHNENYSWQKGHANKKNGKKMGTYLIGLPNG